MPEPQLVSGFKILKGHQVRKVEAITNEAIAIIQGVGGDILSIEYQFDSAQHFVGVFFQVPTATFVGVFEAIQDAMARDR